MHHYFDPNFSGIVPKKNFFFFFTFLLFECLFLSLCAHFICEHFFLVLCIRIHFQRINVFLVYQQTTSNHCWVRAFLLLFIVFFFSLFIFLLFLPIQTLSLFLYHCKQEIRKFRSMFCFFSFLLFFHSQKYSDDW